MNKADKLTQKLIAWFSSRRKVQDWIDTKIHTNPENADGSEFLELRNRSYDLEWDLINMGMRQSLWEEALEKAEAEESEWFMSMELRESIASIEPLPPTSRDTRSGMTMSGWWFIPVAMDTDNQPQSIFGDMLSAVQNKFRDSLHDLAEVELESTGLKLMFSLQLTPFLRSEGLRESLLPPGNFDTWPMEDRNQMAMIPVVGAGLSSACIGVYLAAPDYRSLATIRDLISSMWNEDLRELSQPEFRFGDLGARVSALDEAELLRWEIWAAKALHTPLVEGASTRHVVILVERKEGVPVQVFGHCSDGNPGRDDELYSFDETCRIDGNQALLQDFIQAFVQNARPEVSWSVHSKEIESD